MSNKKTLAGLIAEIKEEYFSRGASWQKNQVEGDESRKIPLVETPLDKYEREIKRIYGKMPTLTGCDMFKGRETVILKEKSQIIIKWLKKNNVEYLLGEGGALSVNINNIPEDKFNEYHEMRYNLDRKYN